MTNNPSQCAICRTPFVGEGETCGSVECVGQMKNSSQECLSPVSRHYAVPDEALQQFMDRNGLGPKDIELDL